MSYAIGKRINEIRNSRKVSQEEIAGYLGMSRQRFARIESGQADLTYALIKKIADYFAVPTTDITSADEETDIMMYFRDLKHSSNVEESVEKIFTIIKTFNVHEKMYYSMKEKKHCV